MNKKILLVFTVCFTLLFAFVISCKNCGGFEDKCKNGQHGQLEWIVVNDSTCSTLGTKNQVCKSCGEIITTASIYYKNHSESIISGKDATCTEDGISSSIECSVCRCIIESAVVVPQIGHNYSINESLCTNEILVYECDNCGDSYEKENTTGSLCLSGHSASSWLTTVDPTCSSLGSAHKVCTVCGVELEIKSIEMTAHTEVVLEGVSASCGISGLTDGIECGDCKKIIQEQIVIEALEHDYKITKTVSPTSSSDGYIEYTCLNCNDTYQTTLTVGSDYDDTLPTTIILSDNGITVSNDNGGVVIEGSSVTINLSGEYDIIGEITEGNIVVTLNEEEQATLNLREVKITSTTTHPIYIESGDKVEIAAKSGTLNYIYDKRILTTTDVVGAAIYSQVDLEIKGKGSLNVISTYNNGIGTTKDLEIKNLTLEVNAPNNALKGNDSLTIESGTIKAISSSGDALKTENSDISDKGNQRGIITILDGTIDLYAACDGIDASYDCIIEGGTINIYTESYSSYSGDVTNTSTSTMYLRVSSRATGLSSISKYSAMFIKEDNTTAWASGTYLSSNGKKYYKFDVPSGVNYVKFFAYSSSQTAGQSSTYSYASDQLTIPTSYDTYYISSASSSKMSGSWENYSTPTSGMGGIGGTQDGNSNSATYSCKGIKADNSITINGGTINIKSHDDGIHTNSDVLLETGSYGVASLTINGGNITVYSDDDGIHADGTLTVNGGNIIISNSYEGFEGNYIYFVGGVAQIKASDDGINAKSTLYFSGSTVYLDAGGDGIDSNGSVYMTDGVVLALGPTNGGNGVIDYGDWGSTFSFSGGLLLAVGCSGMNAKPTASSGNTVSATTASSPSVGSYLTITSNGNVVAVLKVTKSNQNYRVLAYNNTTYPSTSVTVTTSTSYDLTNGLYYVAK